MKYVLAVLLTIQMTCVCAQQYMGHTVTYMSFPIAGGKAVSLPVTDAGPIPAENDKIKIEVAGFNVGPLKSESKIPALIWIFGFTSKMNQKIEKVKIDEVFSRDSATTVLVDEAPKLKDATWSASKESVELAPATFPWLYTSEATIFVFKFSISIEGSAEVVLFQPVWFPEKAKKLFIELADEIRKKT
jgi:hypothetical protein